ncbi:MAG: hypothetical protein ABIQ04_00850 [Candidatus Saccharimonadales bacterium]
MTKTGIRTGILLHVYHLGAIGWEKFVWGDPASNQLGTLTKFVDTLLDIPYDQDVKSIVFSGPSEKEGLIEGAYTKRYLIDRLDQLRRFSTLNEKIILLSDEQYSIFLERVHALTVGPVIKNTLDEVIHAAEYFNHDTAAQHVIQIATPSHAPRCLQNQLIARRELHIPKTQLWYVAASDVCFDGTTIEDVVILEPPHRGDDPMSGFSPNLASVIKSYFKLEANHKKDLIRTIQDTLTRFKK